MGFRYTDSFFRPLTKDEMWNEKLVGQVKHNYAKGNSKLVVWMVANCVAKNGRRDYANRLQRHIPIDIYGCCGNHTCIPKFSPKCRDMIARDYKFVIAFENSNTWDHISEKFFVNLKYNVIPIVFDLHANYLRIAPPKSFINALVPLDFSTVKELANYLKVLDKNNTLYNEYFLWKQQYYVNEISTRNLCSLCSKLHDPANLVSIYRNLTKWWHSDASCKVVKFPTEPDDSDARLATELNPPYEGFSII